MDFDIFSVWKSHLQSFFPTVGILCFSCEHEDCKVTGLSIFSGQNIYYKIKSSSAYSPQTNSWFNKLNTSSCGKSLGANLVISWKRNFLKDG